jgi:integrase
VRWQLAQLGWATSLKAPKTDSSEDIVALDADTVAVLRAHRTRQRKQHLAAGPAWIDTGLVFTIPTGQAVHPADVTDHFQDLARQAGLPPIRLHDLRHGAATLALAAGVDMKTVQAMLRHSSITITADTYTSVLPELARGAAEKTAAIVPRRFRPTDQPDTAAS